MRKIGILALIGIGGFFVSGLLIAKEPSSEEIRSAIKRIQAKERSDQQQRENRIKEAKSLLAPEKPGISLNGGRLNGGRFVKDSRGQMVDVRRVDAQKILDEEANRPVAKPRTQSQLESAARKMIQNDKRAAKVQRAEAVDEAVDFLAREKAGKTRFDGKIMAKDSKGELVDARRVAAQKTLSDATDRAAGKIDKSLSKLREQHGGKEGLVKVIGEEKREAKQSGKKVFGLEKSKYSKLLGKDYKAAGGTHTLDSAFELKDKLAGKVAKGKITADQAQKIIGVKIGKVQRARAAEANAESAAPQPTKTASRKPLPARPVTQANAEKPARPVKGGPPAKALPIPTAASPNRRPTAIAVRQTPPQSAPVKSAWKRASVSQGVQRKVFRK